MLAAETYEEGVLRRKKLFAQGGVFNYNAEGEEVQMAVKCCSWGAVGVVQDVGC